MELYINWIAGAGNTHDVFYTDPRIIASYRKLVFYAYSVSSDNVRIYRVLCAYHRRKIQELSKYLRMGVNERSSMLW